MVCFNLKTLIACHIIVKQLVFLLRVLEHNLKQILKKTATQDRWRRYTNTCIYRRRDKHCGLSGSDQRNHSKPIFSHSVKTHNSYGVYRTVGGVEGRVRVTLADHPPPHLLLCFGRSSSEICHISNKPEVLCFPWKSPQTPQCHWSLAGRGRQASPHRPGFHNRGRESCWQGSPRGHESKEGDYGGGHVKGAFLAVLPQVVADDPHRRLLCLEWGRTTSGWSQGLEEEHWILQEEEYGGRFWWFSVGECPFGFHPIGMRQQQCIWLFKFSFQVIF